MVSKENTIKLQNSFVRIRWFWSWHGWAVDGGC